MQIGGSATRRLVHVLVCAFALASVCVGSAQAGPADDAIDRGVAQLQSAFSPSVGFGTRLGVRDVAAVAEALRAYRPSTGGASGGTFSYTAAELTASGVPLPPNVPPSLDPISWGLYLLGFTNLKDVVNLSCLGTLAAAGGLLGGSAGAEAAAFFSSVALRAGIFVSAVNPAAALAVAETVYAIAWTYLVLLILDGAADCLFNGLWPNRDG